MQIRINKWNEIFENADTRKRQRLGWFHCPSGVDSSGYIELMSHGERGLKAYGVFLAICQWSATCLPVVRGLCARSDGRPMNVRQLAAAIRVDVSLVEDALKLLSSQDVNWITIENPGKNEGKDESADHLPVACQSSADHLPVVCHKEKEKEKEKDREKEKDLSSTCVDVWNAKAAQLKAEGLGYAEIRGLTKDRRAKLRSRLAEAGWLDAFNAGVEALPIRQWSEWVPDFDWMLANSSNALKLAEGKFHKANFTQADRNRQTMDGYEPTGILQELISDAGSGHGKIQAADANPIRRLPSGSNTGSG